MALLGGLALGLCFSQFPEYAQQYEQRLGGAVDELRAVVADFDRDAARNGLSRQQALERFAIAPDQFIVARGTSMAATFARYDDLSTRLAELEGAGPIDRLLHLGDYLDSEIGAKALAAFKPAVPVTPEGLAWGAAGLILGYLVSDALIGFLTLPFRWRRGRAPHRRVPLWWRRREAVVETVALEDLNRARSAGRRADAEPMVRPSRRQEI
jgi:hypothetical protein